MTVVIKELLKMSPDLKKQSKNLLEKINHLIKFKKVKVIFWLKGKRILIWLLEKIIKCKFEAEEAERIYKEQIVRNDRIWNIINDRIKQIFVGTIFIVLTRKPLTCILNQKIENSNLQKKPFWKSSKLLI